MFMHVSRSRILRNASHKIAPNLEETNLQNMDSLLLSWVFAHVNQSNLFGRLDRFPKVENIEKKTTIQMTQVLEDCQ